MIIMKNVILCMAFLFSASVSFSQTITGFVKDNRALPLAGATVRLVRQDDSLRVQTIGTSTEGQFVFANLQPGFFKLSIEMIGHETYQTKLQLDSAQKLLQLPTIVLQPAGAKELGAVVVRSKKPLLEHSIDKTTVNVDAMISSAASNVLEVLSRTPGVTVDNNGSISLNGKSGVLVLIDGRQTYMSASDLAVYLKSIPGASLDKIELIDNPSARYDAAGNAIINLQLKKNRAGGLTGGFSAGYSQGKYGRQNYSLNLNYYSKKITVFTNIGVNADKTYSEDIYQRRYFTAAGDLSSTVALDNNQRNSGRSINIMSGMDYQLSSSTTIGFVGNLNAGKRTSRFDYYSETFDAAKNPAGKGFGNTVGKDSRNNFGLNLNMLHKFKREGQELSGEVNYLNYQSAGQQELENFLEEQMTGITPASRFSYELPSSIHIYTAKADYVQKLKNKGRFEAGIKSSFVKNDNTSDYYDKDGVAPAYDPAMSNRFIYKENINAAYLNGLQNWGRFSAQAGLRMEHTYINGKQPANAALPGTAFSRNYVSWFPSAALSYKLDSAGRNILSVMMSRRLNRPNYQSLNPFLFYRDNYSYSGGNPMLNPQ
ncbi:MAG: TonB-dependent receptor, partial [Chitinophagaceae bacterium]